MTSIWMLWDNIDPGLRRNFGILAIFNIMRSIFFPFFLALVMVKFTMGLSHVFGVVAQPSARGSHDTPIPRLGGLGAALAVLTSVFFMMILWRTLKLDMWVWALLVGGMWALLGGVLDDFVDLGPRWKVLLQSAAMASLLTFGFGFDGLSMLGIGPGTVPPLIGILLATFLVFVIMNFYNFMDGMDGQAAVFGIVVALCCAGYLCSYSITDGYFTRWTRSREASLLAVVAGALAGFLVFNHPRRILTEKTFMGDGGSQFFGFVLPFLVIQSSRQPWLQGYFPLGSFLILFSPFYYDACFTLLRRYRRGERLTQAHRGHLYQRLMVAGWSHGRTLMLNLGLWITMAFFAWLYARAEAHRMVYVQWLAVGLTMIILALYTFFVGIVEDQRRRTAGVTNL